MSWVCLYFFEFQWEHVSTIIVEIKRLDVSPNAPRSERFQWFRLFNQGQRQFCWPLRFLAAGKTVDGQEYRIFEHAKSIELYRFDEKTMYLHGGSTMKRKDPSLLPQVCKQTITNFLTKKH